MRKGYRVSYCHYVDDDGSDVYYDIITYRYVYLFGFIKFIYSIRYGKTRQFYISIKRNKNGM